MKKKKKGFIFKQDRARIFKDERTDTYREKQKYKEPTRCPNCGALYIEGRWTWDETSEKVHEARCPACKRIEDKYPAGFLELRGDLYRKQKGEILHMIRNIEKTENSEHPLERIIEINEQKEYTAITTTGIHLARRLGKALQNAYQGDLDISFDAENFIRVTWQR